MTFVTTKLMNRELREREGERRRDGKRRREGGGGRWREEGRRGGIVKMGGRKERKYIQ